MIIIVITIILNLYKSKRKKYGEILVPILQFLINDKNKYKNGDN